MIRNHAWRWKEATEDANGAEDVWGRQSGPALHMLARPSTTSSNPISDESGRSGDGP